MVKIGNRITELRKKKGWSQTELAKQIGASREAIGKYERDESQPSVETAKKIADAFAVTLDYLVDVLCSMLFYLNALFKTIWLLQNKKSP